MKSSGVPWDVRYQYFTKGWVNNWGYSAYDGSWGLSYMKECDSQHFIPAVEYYQVNGEPGGAESAFLAKVQNATTMKSYFGDFKILMQRAKDFGKPVLILMEADGFGFLQQQTSSNSGAYAAVKDSGLPELSRTCPTPSPAGGWPSCSCESRSGPRTPCWASTSRAGPAARTSPTARSRTRCNRRSTRSTTSWRRSAWRPT